MKIKQLHYYPNSNGLCIYCGKPAVWNGIVCSFACSRENA